jgi:hypothetical protein
MCGALPPCTVYLLITWCLGTGTTLAYTYHSVEVTNPILYTGGPWLEPRQENQLASWRSLWWFPPDKCLYLWIGHDHFIAHLTTELIQLGRHISGPASSPTASIIIFPVSYWAKKTLLPLVLPACIYAPLPGQVEAMHGKYKRVKLGGGQAYNRSSDYAITITQGRNTA